MRSAASDVYYVQILKRVPVDGELDLVVALGTTKDWGLGKGNSGEWGDKATLGILLQRRDRLGTIYQIAVSKGEGDCDARVERATARDVVLSCTPEWGERGPNHKFLYDIRSKALLKQIDYQPFSLQRIFVSGESAVLVGSDTRQLVAVKYHPAREPALNLLNGAQAQQWTKGVGTAVFETAAKHWIHLEPKRFMPVSFGADNRFTLTQDKTKDDPPQKRLAILEQSGRAAKHYSLPQSSYDEFARSRPRRVENGYSRAGTTIDEEIGPCQIANGTLWFAKSFYDGEGNTGVGGFGYFDTGDRKYRIYSPPDIVDWSASALLVEPETVWVALAHYGEKEASSGGLLRFDRASEKVGRIEFREFVSEIACVGDHLLLATDFGAAVVKDGKMRRFFVDQMADGRLQVIEAVLGD